MNRPNRAHYVTAGQRQIHFHSVVAWVPCHQASLLHSRHLVRKPGTVPPQTRHQLVLPDRAARILDLNQYCHVGIRQTRSSPDLFGNAGANDLVRSFPDEPEAALGVAEAQRVRFRGWC